jgi:hypothetical protein
VGAQRGSGAVPEDFRGRALRGRVTGVDQVHPVNQQDDGAPRTLGGNATLGSEERFIERFETDPVVQYEVNRHEQNIELSGSLTAISQAIDAL